ncbi:MAG: DNA-directed RNA polymerase subunit beta' [Chloroflexota bacterium]|nr:DNA-directed RNA polymerase subunit beta' [Chloroflexota bacterium]
MQDKPDTGATNFNAIKISVASPEQILNWSHGEVTKPETINYRTLRPEKDGLFCERLFGPTKDWECFCGKYKRIRYRGVVCDRCGVEVTRSKVRRERMGHIKLAAPVAHIWFSKTTPSRLGLLLDLSPRNLERVLYFAQHIVVSVDEEARERLIVEGEVRLDFEKEKLTKASQPRIEELQALIGNVSGEGNTDGNVDAESAESSETAAAKLELQEIHDSFNKSLEELESQYSETLDELKDLRQFKLLAESKYRELKEKFGDAFYASMGAEAILEILKQVDLQSGKDHLVEEMRSTSGQRRKKAIKRLRVMESFRKSGNRVEDMILSVLPVLPPELRPMVQLDGGRFATSDLNDLYRRVINRNNRLKRLMDLGAPEIIIRNEKRMLQESVDALIDNGRRGRPIQGSHNHKLKSLSDLLRGKQGRFRQNLLGKRVDYSGRSVIVVGPELKMHECGLPKRMALELFKPFVMHRLVMLGISPNIKSAKRMVERSRPEVWDILEEVIQNRPVLLNRAPTLHRLGIQAFMPTLIEGNAIQLHPLVCSAFNADFDGDQMAVHVPLSRMAVNEAKVAMLSTHNMLSPASGDPLVSPTLDMVMGCYYLTELNLSGLGAGNSYYDLEEAQLAHSAGLLDLRAPIKIRVAAGYSGEEWLDTTLGRLIFNEVLPDSLEYQNEVFDRGAIKDLTAKLYTSLTNDETAEVLDNIKSLGFHYATTSGLTIAINDIQVSPNKVEILQEANDLVASYEDQYLSGLMSEDERYIHTVGAWEKASEQTEVLVRNELANYGGIAVMAKSGTKGNITQIKQMAGMRGLMSNPKGKIIDLPIKSSFREGLTALEYFISTHGARKGLADTALRTADSGYLTRRLIDVSQEVIALEQDCGTFDGIWIQKRPDDTENNTLVERIIGRIAATTIANPQTGEIIVERNEEISDVLAAEVVASGIAEVPVRSPLVCESRRGVCQICYGRLPATGEIVELGQATGIIAAQSIGEPGTQLTMRTFHTGGVAGTDITSGLPRVEELFEARVSKGAALLTDIDGVVEITEEDDLRRLRVVSREEYREEYKIARGVQILVEDGEYVEPGMVLAMTKPKKGAKQTESTDVAENLVSTMAGRVELSKTVLAIVWEDVEEREHIISRSALVLVKSGDEVIAGEALTQGPLNPHDILNIRGKDALQKYVVDEVQQVYRSQGVGIHDKHIEIILRQMLRRVQVESAGDSDLIPGQMVDKFEFQDRNGKILAEGGEPSTAKPILLGVTRASLLTDSFLAAASFQETTRVLTQAAVSGAHDWLLGLKENVIIGRLIPAQVESLQMEAEPVLESGMGLDDGPSLEWLEMASEALAEVPTILQTTESDSMVSIIDAESDNEESFDEDELVESAVLETEDDEEENSPTESHIFSPTED